MVTSVSPKAQSEAVSASSTGAAANPLLSYADVAREFAVSVRTARRMVAQKVLRAVKVGHRTVRFRRADIERATQAKEAKKESEMERFAREFESKQSAEREEHEREDYRERERRRSP